MPRVTDRNAHKVEDNRWVAEASDLGLAPGVIPQQMETDLGNRRPLLLSSYNEDVFHYRQDNGVLRLTVLND